MGLLQRGLWDRPARVRSMVAPRSDVFSAAPPSCRRASTSQCPALMAPRLPVTTRIKRLAASASRSCPCPADQPSSCRPFHRQERGLLIVAHSSTWTLVLACQTSSDSRLPAERRHLSRGSPRSASSTTRSRRARTALAWCAATSSPTWSSSRQFVSNKRLFLCVAAADGS